MIDIDYSLNKVSKEVFLINRMKKKKFFKTNNLGIKELEEIVKEHKEGYQNEKNGLHIARNKIYFFQWINKYWKKHW